MSTIAFPSTRPALSDGSSLILSAFAAIFWGTNFEATRIVLDHVTPWTAAAARFDLAAVAILAWLALTRRLDIDVLRRNALAFAALGIIGVFGFNAALFLGMKTSSPITAALIMGTTPLTTNLLGALLSRRLPRGIVIAGMIISLVGVALTVGAFSGTHFATGDLMILAGSIAWAVYTIGCQSWVKEAPAIETSAFTMAFGAVALTVMAFAVENPLPVLAHAGPIGTMAIVHMALIGSVLAYMFWQIGVSVRGAGATSVLLNLVPVAALVVATLFGRPPEAMQVVGVGVAIFGVLLASGRVPLLRRPRLA